MILLRVTYRVRAHRMADFERVFAESVMPLVRERKLTLLGIWRTVVGKAGEYMELWEFPSMAEFERQWPALLDDPRLREVFRTTGPMVDDEVFTLLQPLPGQKPAKTPGDSLFV